jgi:O-acetyl-ADP-ribose deacetylase (regulator of RNase III)
LEPFRELRKHGVLPLGGAVVTGAGKLPYRGIIHVAGIGHDWRASERSIRQSVRSALELAEERGFGSVAFPLIGAGTGGGSPETVERWMREEIAGASFAGRVVLVKYVGGRKG